MIRRTILIAAALALAACSGSAPTDRSDDTGGLEVLIEPGGALAEPTETILGGPPPDDADELTEALAERITSAVDDLDTLDPAAFTARYGTDPASFARALAEWLATASNELRGRTDDRIAELAEDIGNRWNVDLTSGTADRIAAIATEISERLPVGNDIDLLSPFLTLYDSLTGR